MNIQNLDDGIKTTKLNSVKSASLAFAICHKDFMGVFCCTKTTSNDQEKHFRVMLLQLELVVLDMIMGLGVGM